MFLQRTHCKIGSYKDIHEDIITKYAIKDYLDKHSQDKVFTWTKDAGASISRAKKFTEALGIAG